MKQKLTLSILTIITISSIATISYTQNVDAQSLVPEWIKGNAGYWANGDIDDKTFLNGIKFLIENGIILL